MTLFMGCSSSSDGGAVVAPGEDTSIEDVSSDTSVVPDVGSDSGTGDVANDTKGDTLVDGATDAGDALDGDTKADVAVVPVDIDLVATKKNLEDGALKPATFDAPIVITGGVAPFTLTLAPGALPPGLTLVGSPGPAPHIQGAWDASTVGADTATFGLAVADSSGLTSAVRSFTVTLPALADVAPVGGTATSLRDAVKDAAYTEKFVVTSTLGALSFVSTTMPTTVGGGITFDNAAFTFSGTPTAILPKTSYTFVFRDAAKRTITKKFDLTIKNTIPLSLSPATPTLGSGDVSIPDAVLSTAYSQVFTMAPTGNPPYKAVVTGAPLTGLGAVVSADGTASTEVTLSGTPTASGEVGTTSKITITITDALGATTAHTYAVRLLAPAPVITSTSLANARAGVAFSQSIVVTGGTGPLTWSLTSGLAGSGLSLSAAGVVSGTPVAGIADTDLTLMVKVSDARTDRISGSATPRTATASVTLHVNPGYHVNIWPLLNNGSSAGGYGCTGCHGPVSASETDKPNFKGSSFASPSGNENASQLVNTAAGGTAGAGISSVCGGAGRMYVVPGSPSTSLLYQKISGNSSSPPPCGTCMPFTGACDTSATVTAAHRLLIQHWINSVTSATDS